MPLVLKELQRLLCRLITAPSGVAEGLRAEQLPPDGLDGEIAGDPILSARERVDIYADMYFYRLLDSFKEDFPATLAVIGPDHFHNLVTGYLLEYPPSHHSILYAGRYLPRYAASHPLLGQWPFLGDLARLERTLTEVFHAADAEPLSGTQLGQVAPAQWPILQLKTIPAFELLESRWAVAELVKTVEKGESWCQPEQRASSTVVWRRDARVFYRELDSNESLALGAVAGRVSFASLCETVAEQGDSSDPVGLIGTMLQRWVAEGLLRADIVAADINRG